MNENLKTISQIAQELNVTRQAVYQKIKHSVELSTCLRKFTVNEGNKTLYNLQGQELIKSAFESSVNVNCKQPVDSKRMSIDSKLIDTLQTTIETLREQLAVKDKQIEYLQERLAAEQSLHAGTIQKKTIEVKAQAQDKPRPSAPRGGVASSHGAAVRSSAPTKRSLFDRIFKR